MKVRLNPRSQELIKEYQTFFGTAPSPLDPSLVEVNLDLLESWFYIKEEDNVTPARKVLLAELCAELLKDLRLSLPGFVAPEVSPDLYSSETNFTFMVLAIAGALVAACEGFDGITTILGMLSLPTLTVFCAGTAFSMLSIVVFCSFDLIQIARNFGINLIDTPKLLDKYLEQLLEIKRIRRHMETYYLSGMSPDQLAEADAILQLLQGRLNGLADVGNQFVIDLDSSSLAYFKTCISSLAGLLLFAGGFFAGQSLSAFVCAEFFPALPAFWPVVVFSAVVGFAALAMYCYLEKDDLQKMLSSWVGLDEDKIEQLCNPDRLNKEVRKLQVLRTNIQGTGALKDKDFSLANNRFAFHARQPVILDSNNPQSMDYLSILGQSSLILA